MNLRLVRVNVHDKFRTRQGQGCKEKAHGHHEGESQTVRAGDSVLIPGAPVLGEEQHAAAYESPVPGKHETGKLGTKSYGSHGLLA